MLQFLFFITNLTNCHRKEVTQFFMRSLNTSLPQITLVIFTFPETSKQNCFPRCIFITITAKYFNSLILFQNEPQYYQFGYQVQDNFEDDYHGHMEQAQGDSKSGEYKVGQKDLSKTK